MFGLPCAITILSKKSGRVGGRTHLESSVRHAWKLYGWEGQQWFILGADQDLQFYSSSAWLVLYCVSQETNLGSDQEHCQPPLRKEFICKGVEGLHGTGRWTLTWTASMWTNRWQGVWQILGLTALWDWLQSSLGLVCSFGHPLVTPFVYYENLACECWGSAWEGKTTCFPTCGVPGIELETLHLTGKHLCCWSIYPWPSCLFS